MHAVARYRPLGENAAAVHPLESRDMSVTNYRGDVDGVSINVPCSRVELSVDFVGDLAYLTWPTPPLGYIGKVRHTEHTFSKLLLASKLIHIHQLLKCEFSCFDVCWVSGTGENFTTCKGWTRLNRHKNSGRVLGC